jgi:hypothetical protein
MKFASVEPLKAPWFMGLRRVLRDGNACPQ